MNQDKKIFKIESKGKNNGMFFTDSVTTTHLGGFLADIINFIFKCTIKLSYC